KSKDEGDVQAKDAPNVYLEMPKGGPMPVRRPAAHRPATAGKGAMKSVSDDALGGLVIDGKSGGGSANGRSGDTGAALDRNKVVAQKPKAQLAAKEEAAPEPSSYGAPSGNR